MDGIKFETEGEQETPNRDRRTLIKLLLVGGGAFVAGKLFGSVTDFFSDKVLNDIQFKNFRFVETEKSVTVSENGQKDPILIVEKDGL